MKKIVILCLGLLPVLVFAQKEKKYLAEGNKLYSQKKFKEAEQSYAKAMKFRASSPEALFNGGDAVYRQQDFAKAGAQFAKLAENTKDARIAAAAYHNLGNTFLSQKKYEESIEAYKKSLLLNPTDEQTRYNMAYAMEKLKQQKQQDKDKQKQNNKDKDKKDKKDQEQNKDKDKDNKDDKDKKDPNKDQKDKSDNQNKGQQPQPDQLSKDEAQRMLDAMNNQEQQTQDKLKNKKFKAGKARISKEW